MLEKLEYFSSLSVAIKKSGWFKVLDDKSRFLKTISSKRYTIAHTSIMFS